MELEEDAQLMRDLKREIKGCKILVQVEIENAVGSVKVAAIGKIMRQIQMEADMGDGR
jgi:hypothetical protein